MARTNIEPAIRTILREGIHPRRMESALPILRSFVDEFLASPIGSATQRAANRDQALPHSDDLALALTDFLIQSMDVLLSDISSHKAEFSAFNQKIKSASGPEEVDLHILDYCHKLGARRWQMWGNRRALQRWLGPDAMTDRYERRLGELEYRLVFLLNRLGVVSRHTLTNAKRSKKPTTQWRRLRLDVVLTPLLSYNGDPRVSQEAFHCLATALQGLPEHAQETSVSESTLRFTYRSALESHQNVWTQAQALELLQSLSKTSLYRALMKRLSDPRDGDDRFVRRRAVHLLAASVDKIPELIILIPTIAEDPSPFVRQALPAALIHCPKDVSDRWLHHVVIRDTCAPVRASALLALQGLIEHSIRSDKHVELIIESLCTEKDSFVLRTGLHVVTQLAISLSEMGRLLELRRWRVQLIPALEQLHTSSESTQVRRWCAQTKEQLWCHTNLVASQTLQLLQELTKNLRPGKTRRLERRPLQDIDPGTLGRVLSLIAQQDFGFDVQVRKRSIQLTRGDVFRFRWWRFLYEWRNPSPDKRQAHRHTVGRGFRGSIRAPSSILSEMAETKVPGEPVHIADEAGWRPYLPLVDDFLSSLRSFRRPTAVRLFTSEGVTQVVAPSRRFRRMAARWSLTRRFSSIAWLRNWRKDRSSDPTAYLAEVKKLGFEITITPHPEGSSPGHLDPKVTRFFPGIALGLGTEWWQEAQDYLWSMYENTIGQLILFLTGITALFCGRHVYHNYRMRRARQAIPICVGGWGTRGKSGTERLKAAVFNALGYSMVSKTTGCEAMFLYNHTFGALREFFLFRPYDKATIWEQLDIVDLAAKLKAKVFLWECMGLTPAYIEILQRQWMRDNVSTITNTYPDHEDLQGPAGIDIPKVMTRFIPEDACLLTTEESMLPILNEGAKDAGTQIKSITWLDAGLITPDILARFPYDEHPNNIALVMGLAHEYGIPADVALKEMADRVILDLGVLKTYPASVVSTRKLQFINGMSANERFGCLGNWRRCELDQHDPKETPGCWITTVVNNRADRVARSQVFANLLVNDIYADRHFLIGTNLQGMMGYLKDQWTLREGQMSLSYGDDDNPVQRFDHWLDQFRVSWKSDQLDGRLRAMLAGQPVELNVDDLVKLRTQPNELLAKLEPTLQPDIAQTIVNYVRQDEERHRAVEELRQAIGQATPATSESLNQRVRDALRGWFFEKFVVIQDPHSSGDQIIQRIADETPPGIHVKIMGLQNIKGTGLDFVYRWQAWDTCYEACQMLRQKDRNMVRKGLRALASFQDYGLLCEHEVTETLEEVRHRPVAQDESFQAELEFIQSTLRVSMDRVRETIKAVRKTGLFDRLMDPIEAFLDAGDAIQRRKTANQVYRDLVHERISYARAAKEIQLLNKRQKGGHLRQKHAARMTRSREHRARSDEPMTKP